MRAKTFHIRCTSEAVCDIASKIIQFSSVKSLVVLFFSFFAAVMCNDVFYFS